MAADGSIAIALEGVSKGFGETRAVRDVTVAIGEGEFFSLLGPSGCGKTTTLRMIAGFEVPDEGRIVLQGQDVTSVSANRRKVNMVFQQYALFPHMSIYDNVAFGLKVKRVPRGEHPERVHEMLRVVELEGLERRRTRQLSGGQQQRVALARALVNKPAALLLDEPLGALDVKLRKQMQFELKRIQAELGTTFVYVTHDQEEALAMRSEEHTSELQSQSNLVCRLLLEKKNASRSKSILRPSASRTSALPACEVMSRVPCYATVTPDDATIIDTVVDMLTVPILSAQVP